MIKTQNWYKLNNKILRDSAVVLSIIMTRACVRRLENIIFKKKKFNTTNFIEINCETIFRKRVKNISVFDAALGPII